MNEEALRKVDPLTRLKLSQGTLQPPVELLLRTHSPASAAELAQLTGVGLAVETVVNEVIGGRITTLDALEALAGFPWVSEIESSRDLTVD